MKNKHQKIICSLFFISTIFSSISYGQEYIQLQNPSFEDAPGSGHAPMGWSSCGQSGESPPDIHASVNQTLFGVSHPAYHGDTYLGMVVRDNDTWESISQKLSVPMQGGECYVFNLYLAHSGDYWSVSRITNDDTNYNRPAIVAIWGGYRHCEKVELLAQSSAIENFDWQDYQFFFQPSKTFTHLVIEAYFEGNDGVAYNGNVLIDLASPITLANCQTGEKNIKAIDTEIVIEPKLKPKEQRMEKITELEEMIKKAMPFLIFAAKSEDLTSENAAKLELIGQSKLDFSRFRLEISVKANPPELAKERIQSLKNILIKKNIPETSYKIYHERVTDNQKDWLDENEFLRIGLRDRLK